MLTSLFGDLDNSKKPQAETSDKASERGFAATAISQSVDTEVNARGQIVDRHSSDLVVTGSPALAIREHFAVARSDLEKSADRQIALYDPANAWAGAVIKALSDAAGSPIDRLHLREKTTLRSLATIERTTLKRRNEDTLKIYNVEVRAPGPENAEIPIALLESSHLAVVVIGPMEPHAIDAMLSSLHDATNRSTWRSRNVLFIVPPSAVWIANKIMTTTWPALLRVKMLDESLNSASAVWNAVLGVWNELKGRSGADDGGESGPPKPLGVPTLGVERRERTPRTAEPSGRHGPSSVARRAGPILAEMNNVPGLLGCAVVDIASGMVLARYKQEAQSLDIELAASASSQVLRSHRLTANNMGLPERIDEIMTSAGARLHILRTVAQHPEAFLFAVLDKRHADLSLARYRLMEAEKSLA